MSKSRLTKRAIDSANPKDSRYTVFDEQLPGFGLRVFPSGEKSWIVEYRPNGGGRRIAKRRITLGSVAALTPDQARKAAAEILARARLGGDPARDAADKRQAISFADLVDSKPAD